MKVTSIFQVCSDRNGWAAVDGIEIVVLNRPFSERFGVEFSFIFDRNVGRRRVQVVELISTFFGDPTPRNVVIKSIEDGRLVWYNKTLAYADCADPRIDWLRDQILVGGPMGKPNPDLVQHFGIFQLRDVSVILRGSCFTTISPKVTESVDTSDIFHGLIPASEYLLTFLIPAVIILGMLLLAICLACLLHNKRKEGKLNLFYSETLPPRVPVILQDELYDESDPAFPRQQFQLAAQNMDPPEMDRLVGGKNFVRPTPNYHRD